MPNIDPVDFESGTNTIRLEAIGRYSGGLFDPTPTSTPHYDPTTQRLFVPRSRFGQVLALDISDPSRPMLAFSIDTLEFGGLPSSVDVKDGIVAVALRRFKKTRPGAVVFFDANGAAIGGPVGVGAQPNMLAFTPDGRRVIVANAGEANDDYTIDPEGSISVVELVGIGDCLNPDHPCRLEPDVKTVNFQRFNNRRNELVAAGVRIFGPNASVAEDVEPESLALHITWRNWGQEEDRRYQTIRKNNQPNFEFKSLYIVFLLQAFLAVIVALPLMSIFSSNNDINILDYLALALWLTGMFFETVGDLQLSRFKASAPK